MSKKKRPFRPSHTRKLRDRSAAFFAKYDNNVTRKAFASNYEKFIAYCRSNFNCKTKDECRKHIDDYVDCLKQRGLSANTIHSYLAPVVLYHGMMLNDVDIPQRSAAANTRSRKKRASYRPNADPGNKKYARSVEFQKRVGIRRAEQAVRAYEHYSSRIEGEPGYERKLASEIIRRWNAYNLGENGKPKYFDRRNISGIYRVRGENKKLALKKGLPTEYNRLALMAVSVFHLSHWRLDVTVSNYLLAV